MTAETRADKNQIAETQDDETQTDGVNRVNHDGGTPSEGMHSNAGEGYLNAYMYVISVQNRRPYEKD